MRDAYRHGRTELLYIRGVLRAKVITMGLLAQLFRHKSASASDSQATPHPSPAEADIRGLGAIAAAAGVKTGYSMPSKFELTVGDLIARVPQQYIQPGAHDFGRAVRIPAADVAPGLARGKAELPISRLAALSPEVFRWEHSDLEGPKVRLPIQKLLQQIRSESPAPADTGSAPARTEAHRLPSVFESVAPSHLTVGTPIVSVHLTPISFEKAEKPTEAPPPPAPLPQSESLTEPPPEPEVTQSPEPGHPAPSVTPAPPNPEARPPFSNTASGEAGRTIELRPSRDASIATTLRAVVLGGIAPSSPPHAPGQPSQILAPRIAPTAPVAPPPIVLGPSVVSAAPGASPSLTPHATPDFEGLRNLFMTPAPLDVSAVASLVAGLPGVHACVISGSAGSASAGDFLRSISAEEMRAASARLARIGGAATEIFHRGESDIALFLHDDVCVATAVTAGGFVPGVRDRLARVAELLAGPRPAR